MKWHIELLGQLRIKKLRVRSVDILLKDKVMMVLTLLMRYPYLTLSLKKLQLKLGLNLHDLFLMTILLVLGLVIDAPKLYFLEHLLWMLLLLRQSSLLTKKGFIADKLETMFPEEWQADLKTLQERWVKQSYSCQKIRFLTIKHIFHMVLGYIQIQVENIWLPNNASTKEIE